MGTKERSPSPQDRLRFLQARARRAMASGSVGDMQKSLKYLRDEQQLLLDVPAEQQLQIHTAMLLLLYHLADYEQAALLVERIWRIVQRAPRLRDPVPADLVQALCQAGHPPRKPRPQLVLPATGMQPRFYRSHVWPHVHKWSHLRDSGLACCRQG